MTSVFSYTVLMDILNCLNSAVVGGVFLGLLFIVCFLGVHIVKLARRGYEETLKVKKGEQPQQSAPEQEKKPVQKTPEPVYYIVEKKKKRPKSSYSDPKEFRFK